MGPQGRDRAFARKCERRDSSRLKNMGPCGLCMIQQYLVKFGTSLNFNYETYFKSAQFTHNIPRVVIVAKGNEIGV